jgi:predicted nucleotidyltransferase
LSKLVFDTEKLIEIYRWNNVIGVGVFSSFAGGEANEQSDIDLLVRVSSRKNPLDVVALERRLSAAMGRKVDLLTEWAITPHLREGIRRDLKVIHEEAR